MCGMVFAPYALADRNIVSELFVEAFRNCTCRRLAATSGSRLPNPRLFCRLNHGPDMSARRASVRRELIPPCRSEPTHDRTKDAGLPRIRARREPDTTIQRMAETRVGRDKRISFGTEFLQTVERGLHRWRSSRRYGCRGSFPSQRRARRNPSHSACRYRGARGAEEGQK
jgi:hypothetical protein